MPKLALLVLIAIAPVAKAFCPAPAPKACSAFFTSDQVFYGEVLKRELVGAGTQIRFTINVERVLKGQVAGLEVVTTGNDSGRWSAQPGERRVVFAQRGRVGDLCGFIDEASHAQATIAAIAALSAAKQARVEGEVVSIAGPGGAAANEGAQVVVRGSHRTYRARTDRQGRFSLDVPPGRYALVAPEGFGPAIPYSRDDVAGFDVVAGQCAQFQLAPK